jgi:hypothetical protein
MARNPVGHTLNAGGQRPATQAASARYWLEVKAGIIPGSRYC